MRIAKLLGVTLACVTLMTACGGGGGGGEQNTPPPQADNSWLTFGPSPLTIIGKQGQATSFSIKAFSSKIIKEKVNIAIVDNDAITIPTTTEISALSETVYNASMQLKPTLATGSRSGSFTLKICLDDPELCKQPYPGSPWRIPYTLDIQPGDINAWSSAPLSLTQVDGNAAPAVPAIQVMYVGAWSAVSSANWISLDKSSGTGSSTVQPVIREGLAQGSYKADLIFTSTEGKSVVLKAYLEVRPPAFVLGSTQATFQAINGTVIEPQTITVALDNGKSTQWSAISSAPWLSATATTSTSPMSLRLAVEPSRGSLASGNYDAQVNFSAPGIESRSLAVRLILTPPTLSTTAETIVLGGSVGRDLTAKSLSFNINTGESSYPWTLSALPSWLSVNMSSGTVSQSQSPTLSFVPNANQVGSKSATVVLSAKVNGDSITKSIRLASGFDRRKIIVSETGVALSQTPGWARLSRKLKISDNFGMSTAWTATSDKAWLNVTSSGTTGNNAGTLNLQVEPDGVAQNSMNYALVTIASSDPAVQSSEKVVVGFWKGTQTPSEITKLSQEYTKLLADPIRPWVYAHNDGSTIDVYNVYTSTKISNFSNIAASSGAMTIAPDGSELYVIDKSAKRVVVINPETGAKLRAFSLVLVPNAQLAATYLRTNGVGILALSDGTAYLAADGSLLKKGETLFGGSAALAAAKDGSQIFMSGPQGLSPAYPGSAMIDYSAMNEGSFFYTLLPVIGDPGTPVASNAADVAVSQDGSRFYSAAGAPYACMIWNAKDGAYIGLLPGGNAYPNNVEVGSDGRVYCGIFGWYSEADVWMYSSSGQIIKTFKFAGYAKALLGRSLAVSGDGLMGIALTDDPSLVFLPFGQ